MGQDKTFTNSIGMEFVLIPAGTFLMGSSDDDEMADDEEKPRHEVTISRPFFLGKYPVTQAQWQAVMGNNPSGFKDPGRPVECVSWDDIQWFIRRLNTREGRNSYRLPTEAEWEYACRAGSTSRYCFGDDANRLGKYAWFYENYENWERKPKPRDQNESTGGSTHPVGLKKPNAWWLYDMHGNVWEWCSDWYDANDYQGGLVVDPQGPATGEERVLRGGCWCNEPWYCRSAVRLGSEPGGIGGGMGFRLALSPVR